MIINQLCSKSVFVLIFSLMLLSVDILAQDDVLLHDRIKLTSSHEKDKILKVLQSIGDFSKNNEVDIELKPFDNTNFYFLEGVDKQKK